MSVPPFDDVRPPRSTRRWRRRPRHRARPFVAGGTTCWAHSSDRIHPADPAGTVRDLKRISGLRSIEERRRAPHRGAVTWPISRPTRRCGSVPPARRGGQSVGSSPSATWARSGATSARSRAAGTTVPRTTPSTACARAGPAARRSSAPTASTPSSAPLDLETPCETNCPNHTAVPLLMPPFQEGDLRRVAEVLLAVTHAGHTGRVCRTPARRAATAPDRCGGSVGTSSASSANARPRRGSLSAARGRPSGDAVVGADPALTPSTSCAAGLITVDRARRDVRAGRMLVRRSGISPAGGS